LYILKNISIFVYNKNRKMRKIAVIGSRTLPQGTIETELRKIEGWAMLIAPENCKNIARAVLKISSELGLGYELKPIEYKKGKHPMAAITERNKKLIAEASEVIAIWDGKSKGTEREIKMAKKAGKAIKLIRTDQKQQEEQGGLF